MQSRAINESRRLHLFILTLKMPAKKKGKKKAKGSIKGDTDGEEGGGKINPSDREQELRKE